MHKFERRNGWTKQAIIAHIKAEFKGRSEQRHSPNGAKDAVGLFIPNHAYDVRLDKISDSYRGFSVYDICHPHLGLKLDHFMPLEFEGMHCLVYEHDSATSDIECLNNMLTFIEKYVAE